MNSVQVNCFLNVANLKSFTQASEILFLSQPTISRYVSSLEKELGCKLIDRTTKHVELTKAGELYYHMFSQWKVDWAMTEEKIQILNVFPTQVVKIGYMEDWQNPVDLDLYRERFHELYPQIQMKFVALSIPEIMDRLSKKTLDVGVVIDNPLIEKYHLQNCLISRLQKQIIYSSQSPLARKKDLCIQDFKKETFFVIEGESDYPRQRLSDYCKRIGIFPQIETIENINTIIAYIRNNKGVAIFDEWVNRNSDPSLNVFPLSIYGDVYLVWHEEMGFQYSNFFDPSVFPF